MDAAPQHDPDTDARSGESTINMMTDHGLMEPFPGALRRRPMGFHDQ
jgi:hypothetical protein